MIEPLTLSFEIGCSPEHAFDVWTTRLSNWWPKGHSASGDPDTFVVLEPRLARGTDLRTYPGRHGDRLGGDHPLESTEPPRVSLAHLP